MVSEGVFGYFASIDSVCFGAFEALGEFNLQTWDQPNVVSFFVQVGGVVDRVVTGVFTTDEDGGFVSCDFFS